MPFASPIVAGLLLLALCTAGAADLLPGFHRGPWFGEQILERKTETGVRMLFNAPMEMKPGKPTLLVFYATPNGNTIEQTLGCSPCPDLDWHFDIQHIAAQTRKLREIAREENVVLVCLEAEGRSWPAWRQKRADNAALIRGIVEDAMKMLPGEVHVVLTGHSGGGSMIFGFLNSGDAIPPWVTRIAFLDSNYAYSDDEKHGDKLLAWLRASQQNHLVVIAYDDREITVDGKRVVGPTGGTWRASQRMLHRFQQEVALRHTTFGEMDRYEALDGRIVFLLHRNPGNKILHTALVGDMNGYLEALTLGTSLERKWGAFGGPRAYTRWIQPAEFTETNIPARLPNAEGGAAIMKQVASLPRAEREAVLLSELRKGNLPPFLRGFIPIRTKGTDASGKEHSLVYQVMPDYLAVGSDQDFVRVPLTPMTAQPIADLFRCSLPTRKMVDEIYRLAQVKLEPRPLTEAREAVETFVQHNAIIESQRALSKLGALTAGTKKDVVITNLLYSGKPNRVAIYGWHKLDGSPIQPLTTVHVNWYVDYSHGIRLVKRAVLLDGQPRDLLDILKDPVLSPLLSDEGPIAKPYYE